MNWLQQFALWNISRSFKEKVKNSYQKSYWIVSSEIELSRSWGFRKCVTRRLYYLLDQKKCFQTYRSLKDFRRQSAGLRLRCVVILWRQSDLHSKLSWTELTGFYCPALSVSIYQASHGRWYSLRKWRFFSWASEDSSVAQGRIFIWAR